MGCGYIVSEGEAPFSASDAQDFKRIQAEELMYSYLKTVVEIAKEWGLEDELIMTLKRDILPTQ